MKSGLPRALVPALLTLILAGAAAASAAPGVVAEKIGPGSALERGGLQPGDLLLAWEREGEAGEIRTVFDWLQVKIEQAPRGPVVLRGERDGAALSFQIPRGDWESRVRPWMAADLLAAYAEGRKRIEAGDVEGGTALWEPLAELRPWILLETAEAWSAAGRHEKARAVLEGIAGGDTRVRVAVLDALGRSRLTSSDMVLAEESFRAALALLGPGESLRAAALTSRLGLALRRQNRMAESAQAHSEALRMRERLAPDSLDVAESLKELAILAWARGELQPLADYARRALEIQERWAPGTLAAADILNYVAISSLERGLFEEGKAALRRALAIQERLAPGSLQMATSLANLGAVARQTGDLEGAEELLGRALAIRTKLAPESNGVAVILSNLGMIARDRGELDKAAELFRRAVSVWEKAAPQGIGAAANRNALGTLARLQGRLDEAWELHSRALEVRQRIAPGSLEVAESLGDLGEVAQARGDLQQALDFHQRNLAIYERLAPGTTEEALTLQRIGRLHLRQGRVEEAARVLARAIGSLESQVGRLGVSPDSRARFRASYEEIYLDAIQVELERGRAAEAFHLVERSRARSFLTRLAERDLGFAGDVPPELEQARKDNAVRHDRALRNLALAPDEEAREALRRELDRLRQERDGIAEKIRAASPRLADLREPQPLDLEAARKVLDPGTLALTYSVGKEKTALFALTRDGFWMKTLPVGEERLRKEVGDFLEKVRSQQAGSANLYRELIGPVADLVAKSERLLILPDGPLHRLPFGALVTGDGEDGRFLIEEKPLHTALSLTVYRTLRASAPPGPAKLVAFGDPRFPQGMEKRSDLSPGLRSFDWSRLPYSRSEVERIAGVYPSASLYLGEEATEERARSIRDARILHFATHGYTDDRTPLDSALVLTISEEPGRENGLLQVWEIFESVRTDADLVVLSACESALGRELSGEGLIGLTRAFQYAGARSVVASLWSVADQVTAELMARFHRHLASGLDKDEALRAAQIELIRKPVRITTPAGQVVEIDASAPFFWAAFQLFGDWK